MRVKRRSAPISRIPARLTDTDAVLVTGPPPLGGRSRPAVPRAVPLTFLLAGGLAVVVLSGSGILGVLDFGKPVGAGPVGNEVGVGGAARPPARVSIPAPRPGGRSERDAPRARIAREPNDATAVAPLTPPPVTPPPASSGSAELELADRFRRYLATRPGHASVAIYDAVTGRTVAVDDPSVPGFETASTVKLAIAVELLKRAGPTGQLTVTERREATAMIGVSDNAAASWLWSAVGGATAMDGLFRGLGMTSTVAGLSGLWGLTRTTAADQLALLRTVAYPNPVLSAAGRAVANNLLHGVIPSQRWGVPDSVPRGVSVEVKNGWLPRANGWVIDSIGHVHGAGRDYVIAAYTRNGPSMQSGIDTVAGLSALAWKAVAAGPPSSTLR
jgi:beta-lactamase class A